MQTATRRPARSLSSSFPPAILLASSSNSLDLYLFPFLFLKMCMKATCSTCQKTTWWGCGNHIPAVLDAVPESERCTCEPKVERDGKQYPPKGSN
ncbi:hypothetical protein BDW71DRAFT_211533 [Aspergillus fruticulosus]